MNNKIDLKATVKDYDKDKLKAVIEVQREYKHGKLTKFEARRKLKDKIGTITPMEIAIAEQEIKEYDTNQCQKLDIQSIMDIFEGVMDVSRPDLPEDHPLSFYYRENEELEKVMLEIEDLIQYPVIKNQWYEIYDKLKEWNIHLQRKQNQLYPVLEKKGFDRPTTTMWVLDDFVRDEIKEGLELLETNEDEFIKHQVALMADIRDLIKKEESILYPTSIAFISDEEFEYMKSGDREIGFAYIKDNSKKAVKNIAPVSNNNSNDAGFAGELQQLLEKYGYSAGGNKELDVSTGKLTLEQINLIFKNMPVDLSYVDENEIVKFYTDTKHRIFPRSKNVIGRDVKNCHPRKSVHIVEEIVEKFRSGEEDSAEFWINKPDLFIHITYIAIRDDEGKFRGILEMMQDCTHIRSLTGSQTLLTWGKNNMGVVVEEEEEAKEPSEDVNVEERENLVLTKDTKMSELFKYYPELKNRMEEIDSAFKMLKTPLAKVMLKKATITTASDRTGMPVEKLIEKINKLIDEIKTK